MQGTISVRCDRVNAAVNHLWNASNSFQLDADKQMTEVEWECVLRRLMECIKTGKPTFGW